MSSGNVTLRVFGNYDVPGIVALWNASMEGAYCAFPLQNEPFERLVLSKLYFDRMGIRVAEADGQLVGMVHAGFGPDRSYSRIDRRLGVVSMIMVHPDYRRRGIGSGLLEAAHGYLAERGAKAVYAGASWPLVPFYVGLYGGSEIPGVVSANEAARGLLEKAGYESSGGTVIMQRRAGDVAWEPDARFRDLRRDFELVVTAPFHNTTWWFNQNYGCFNGEQIYLKRKDSGQAVARATVWDMTEYGTGQSPPIAGIIDVLVAPEARRKAIGKYLMRKILQRLDEMYVGLAELQTGEQNEAALNLYNGLGFKVVGRGLSYKLARPLTP